jgi:CHASE3 domain sensor protein/CheY-like chemotaxis protein
MKFTIGKKIGLGFGVVLCLMATLAVVVLFHLDNMHRQFAFVIEHDAPVIANARELQKLVVDMETGQRGFVITGKQEFLDPYENARTEFARLVKDEKALVSDNPPQVRRLERIEAAIEQWQIKAAKPEIAMRRKILEGKVDAVQLQDMLRAGVGKGILDEIRIIADDMEQQFRVDGNMHGVYLIKAIQKCMVDQETGERGFLITGKDEFLEPYNAGQTELKRTITELRSLIASAHDRAATVSDLSDLKQLHARWIAEAADPEIQLRRQVTAGEKTAKDIEAALSTSLGKSILDEMRAVLDRMSARFLTAENEQLQGLLVALGKAIVDQETGQRGFLITGKDEFLKPFNDGRKDWDAGMLSLRDLNARAYDLPLMQRNTDQLERLAGAWLTKAAKPEIDARREMNKHPETLQDVADMLEVGTGKRILDSIRNDFRLFIEEEESLTSGRFTAATLAASTTTRSTIVLTILSLIFGGGIGLLIKSSITKPGRDNQRLLSFILKKVGADVTIAENGQVAFDLAMQARDGANPFDVILMDMQMPVLDGYQATGKLREAGYSGPIIALTAHAMAEHRQQCLDAGCDDFASMPIDRQNLIAIIKNYTSGETTMSIPQNSSDVLVSELADDEDMLELIEMFVGDFPDRIAELERAIDERDIAELARLAHQLKGSAG